MNNFQVTLFDGFHGNHVVLRDAEGQDREIFYQRFGGMECQTFFIETDRDAAHVASSMSVKHPGKTVYISQVVKSYLTPIPRDLRPKIVQVTAKGMLPE